MESKKKYYKSSITGEIVCVITYNSDVIKDIPTKYYDLHMRLIGEEFDLTGFVEIKEKKFDLYRSGRWNPGKINSFFNERYEYHKK
jgi:hypothetical protein